MAGPKATDGNLLIDGLTWIPKTDDEMFVWLPIFRADDDEPEFEVRCRLIPIPEYRSMVARQNRRVTAAGGNEKLLEQIERENEEELVDKIVADWRGLTARNLEQIVRTKMTLGGPQYEKLKASKVQVLEPNEKSRHWLWRSAWPVILNQKVIKRVLAAEADEAREIDEGKDD